MLLHNGNKFACVPIGHSVILKEYYATVKMVLQTMCYDEHNWIACVDNGQHSVRTAKWLH